MNNHSEPTERTPLLPGSSRPPRDAQSESTVDGLPHVGPFVAGMRPEDLHKYSADNLYPPTLQSRPDQVAFSLSALLYYRKYLGGTSHRRRDVWAQWRQEQVNTAALETLDSLIGTVWESFIGEEGSPKELIDVLWTAFPLYPDSRRTIRVVDYLENGETPSSLASHSLIHMSLFDTWIYGRPRPSFDGQWSWLWRFVDSTGNPRAIHAIEWTLYIGYLALLCNYVVAPPVRAEMSTSELRPALLLTYAIARMCRPWSTVTLPFALVVLAFIIALPGIPSPENLSFTFLLVAFCWKMVLLHLPAHPSPLLWLSADLSLPLAVLVRRGLVRTFIPVVTFFIPGVLISLLMLSVSLADTFLRVLPTMSVAASPMDTRIAFLGLLTIIFLFMCCTLGYVVVSSPLITPTDGVVPVTWDRHSMSVGLEARQEFVRAVATYAAPRYFPAPFNLLQVFFVDLPRLIFVVTRWKTALKIVDGVEIVLWRIVVAPFSFLVSAFWLWNLPGRW